MNRFSPRALCFAVATVVSLSACSTIEPKPLTQGSLAEQGRADRATARVDVEPLSGPLTLDEAIARALKYNLDRRVRLMEEAMTFRQLDVSHYDMLPKLMARAGYSWRDNDNIRQSRNADNGELSQSQFISEEREHTMSSLGASWDLLDFGVGYYNTKQQAERVLIAGERRRKAMHVLMQDVRTAYWRAVSAQKLRQDVHDTIKTATEALADSRKAETERLRNPLDSLRYQRQVLENLRLLEAIDQELSTAQVELAALINAPLGSTLVLSEPEMKVDRSVLEVPVERMEESAITSNPDIREQHYNARIAREETRKTLAKLFPNLRFNYDINYDTDSYLLNDRWNEAGVQLSFNLFNLLTGPGQLKLAEAGVNLADQRRVATQMAVLTQVHLGRLQLNNAFDQFERADAIWNTDNRISEHLKNRESTQAQSKLDVVANQTTTILSLLRRYQALAQVQAAKARLQSTLGLEPAIPSVGEISLQDLTRLIGREQDGWAALSASTPAGNAQ